MTIVLGKFRFRLPFLLDTCGRQVSDGYLVTHRYFLERVRERALEREKLGLDRAKFNNLCRNILLTGAVCLCEIKSKAI